MSNELPPLPPPFLEQADLSVDLDDALLQVLLLGIYTPIYFGTLYVYLTRKSSRQPIVLGVVSLSYAIYAFHSGLAWFLLKQDFIDNGATLDTVFESVYLFNTGWKTLYNDISSFVLAALADGLLIWRCYHVWNRSLRAIILPVFLLLSSIGLDITIIVIAGSSHLRPSNYQAVVLDDLTVATFFVICATTLSSTLLISYRIYTVYKQDVLQSSRRWLLRIITILAESAAAYAIASILAAVAVIPSAVVEYTFSTYSTAFFMFTSGVAPTIMVARIALSPDSSEDKSMVTRLSGLQFHHQSNNPAQSEIESVQIEPRNSSLQKDIEKGGE